MKQNDDRFGISIILPVYNEELTLGKCLESLLNIDYAPLEILVVDDGSTDNSLHIANVYQATNKNKMTVFSLPHKGRSYSFNYALKKAKYPYIYFAEADGIYDKQILSKLIRPFHERNDVGGTLPCYHPIKLNTVFPKFLDNDRSIRTQAPTYVPIACKLCRKDILLKIGGLDESMSGGDDAYQADRIRALGFKTVFVPDAAWYHMDPDTLTHFLKKFFIEGYNLLRYRFHKGKEVLRARLRYYFQFLLSIELIGFLSIFLSISQCVLIFLSPFLYTLFLIGYTKLFLARNLHVVKYKKYLYLTPILYAVQTFLVDIGTIVRCFCFNKTALLTFRERKKRRRSAKLVRNHRITKLESCREKMKNIFDGLYSSKKYKRDEKFYQRYVRRMKEGGRVLEVGCGTGEFLHYLASLNNTCYGIDFSTEGIRKAKSKSQNRDNEIYVVGDAHELPFKNEVFNTVGSYWLMEHIEDVDKCIDEQLRVLKKNGHIVIYTYNHANISEPWEVVRYFSKKRDYVYSGLYENPHGTINASKTSMVYYHNYLIKSGCIIVEETTEFPKFSALPLLPSAWTEVFSCIFKWIWWYLAIVIGYLVHPKLNMFGRTLFIVGRKIS